MERIALMFVVPDIFPTIDPKIDIDVTYQNRWVEPGMWQLPAWVSIHVVLSFP